MRRFSFGPAPIGRRPCHGDRFRRPFIQGCRFRNDDVFSRFGSRDDDVFSRFGSRDDDDFGRFRPVLPGAGFNRQVSGTYDNIHHNQGFIERNNNDRSFQPDPAKVIAVSKVNLLVESNSVAHHTDEYDISSKFKRNPLLVVRRGQPFNIEIEFSKPYDSQKDDLRLVFQAGDTPLPSKGTHVEFILSDKDFPGQWGAKILSRDGNTLTVTIFTPPDCFVAKWAFKVDVVKKDDTDVNVYRYNHPDPIYIIFNPWCKADDVYMEDKAEIAEYVLNEVGHIYSGSKQSISDKPWNFGQFESCVLDVAMYLLDNSGMNWAVRGRPVNVIRRISAMVNSSDDDGVLTGNWSGNYAGGRSPLSWTGSAAILEKYWDTKRPVKFGQCWVFSGVSTTVCRALGIPCRSVTNFASAHDTDGSITIDIHLDSKGEPDEYLNRDSIWNFHVWNEAWMARPDLPKGYGGWQCFDATPQETSDDVYCCGPASVRAIREGLVNLPYDGPFIFAEVNADRMYWMPNRYGEMKSVYNEENAVGKFISTKAPGTRSRLDVTDLYKPEEGSAEERAAVLRANQVGSNRRDIYICKEKDVEFNVDNDAENTWVGEDFVVGLRIKNTSAESREINGSLTVSTMYYTGVVADKVALLPLKNVIVGPGKETILSAKVNPADYVDKLKDCCMIDVSVCCKVKETDQVFSAKEAFILKKPTLAVKGPREGSRDTEFKVDVSFTNPLDVTLTECQITVDGLAKSLSFPYGNIGPKSTFVATLPITPIKTGHKELIIIFGSKQLEDVHATHDIFVRA